MLENKDYPSAALQMHLIASWIGVCAKSKMKFTTKFRLPTGCVCVTDAQLEQTLRDGKSLPVLNARHLAESTVPREPSSTSNSDISLNSLCLNCQWDDLKLKMLQALQTPGRAGADLAG